MVSEPLRSENKHRRLLCDLSHEKVMSVVRDLLEEAAEHIYERR